ncbi:MAG: Gfo/Idh/MocA family protein [Promethearchaeota archaeon]
MDAIRFGVIGTGARTNSIINNLMKDKEKRADIVAICDNYPPVLEKYEKLIKNKLNHDVKKYTDYKELLDNGDVDAVIIGTPDFLHHEMAVAAFNAKKHVFLEKPVGINLEQMINIVRAAKKSGKILEVGYVLRYTPFYNGIRKIVQSQEIGRTLFVNALEEYYGAFHFYRGWWRFRKNVGGIMIQKICHDMDLWHWIFGKPKKIVAFESLMEFKPGNWESSAKNCSECDNHCPYYITDAINSRTRSDECVYNGDHDISDNTQILIQFENGMNMNMGMNFFNSRGQSDRFIRIVGSKAEITGRLSEGMVRIDPRFKEQGAKYLQLSSIQGDGHAGGDEVQVIEFINALTENREAKAGIESAYWSSIMIMGAQLSADTGKIIDIDELTRKYPFP